MVSDVCWNEASRDADSIEHHENRYRILQGHAKLLSTICVDLD